MVEILYRVVESLHWCYYLAIPILFIAHFRWGKTAFFHKLVSAVNITFLIGSTLGLGLFLIEHFYAWYNGTPYIQFAPVWPFAWMAIVSPQLMWFKALRRSIWVSVIIVAIAFLTELMIHGYIMNANPKHILSNVGWFCSFVIVVYILIGGKLRSSDKNL